MRKRYRDDKGLKEVGERIREIRKLQNMTQEELANKCGLDYSQVNRMELGKVDFSFSQISLIASGLQVHRAKLLY